ncbi:STAS domain-containing protein [Leptospira stimsonii]|uniref:Anti-anti-sigma factor n=1 Tax=Leptospira stimsonii TaxID=2202203 RepID=A0A4R9KYH7_9LEPT|nr:STAS domain-containing protein [Leptospira stimsonii]RHX86707.1 anti-anti-sigma factor [Leptospira stimsonii]RHX90462.1 anti-anti-sigma factor [Leptospira stimsonii]TGK13304.1 anti-sigma factor antagonist [Leptospira stimsonii]TGM09081.1 anti-sigma factor antagonist [Leptospira stimsonii]
MAFQFKKESVVFRTENAQVNGLRIVIEGELTIYDALELKGSFDEILKNKNSILEIDLSKITKIDTSCLQILLALKMEARKKEFTIRLINHSHAVLKLIDLYGLTGFLRDKIKLQKEDLKEFSFQYGMGKD